MVKNCRILLFVCVLSALCFFPQPSFAVETQHIRPVGEWLTEPVSDDGDAEIDFCLVRNYFSNGLIMILAEDKNGSRRMALNFPSSRLQPGTQHPVTLSIDNIWQQSFQASAADDDMLVIPFVTVPRIWERLSKGYALTIKGKNDAVEFDLSGTGEALNSLRDCVQSRLSRDPDSTVIAQVPNEQDPSAAATKAPPALPSGIADILYTAGYKEIMPVPLKGEVDQRPLDYAWTMGDLFGGVKQIQSQESLHSISQDYFKLIRPICKGPFVAEGAPAYEVAGIAFMRSEIGCSSPIKDTISAVLFYKIGNLTTVFFFETTADKGAEAIKARNRIARVAEHSVAQID